MYQTSYKYNSDILDRLQRRMFKRAHPAEPLLPPTERETKLIEELRAKMLALPLVRPEDAPSGPERMWTEYKNELREDVANKDPREFLKWYIVDMTMGASLRRRNYLWLAKLSFWSVWREKIANMSHLYLYPYFKFPQTDGTTLSHAYHLAQLKERLGKEVTDVDLIVDFGGGFGSMCALTHAMGFTGKYIIFDWPEFLLLQEFYLKLQGVDTTNIKFVSTFPDLRKEVGDKRGLLIATWSISETGENFRNEFFKNINPEYYIIGYQQSVAEVDNHEYFRKFADNRPNTFWEDFPIYNLPGEGNRYLLGRPNN